MDGMNAARMDLFLRCCTTSPRRKIMYVLNHAGADIDESKVDTILKDAAEQIISYTAEHRANKDDVKFEIVIRIQELEASHTDEILQAANINEEHSNYKKLKETIGEKVFDAIVQYMAAFDDNIELLKGGN